MLPASSLPATAVATFVALVATALAPGVAHADETISSRAADDAAVGRSYFAPTALNAPEGSVTLNLRAPLYPAISASINATLTDRIEVFVGAGAAIVLDDEGNNPNRLVGGGVKLQVLRTASTAVALTGSAYRREAYFHTDPFEEGWDEPALVIGEVGAVGTTCLDARCNTIVTAHAHYLPELRKGGVDRVWGGGSIVAGRGRSRIVADATLGREADDTGLLGYLGYRAARETWSFDAGLLVVADGSGDVLPWPTFGVSARW